MERDERLYQGLYEEHGRLIMRIAQDEDQLRLMRRERERIDLEVRLVEIRLEATREVIIALGGRIQQAEAPSVAVAEQSAVAPESNEAT